MSLQDVGSDGSFGIIASEGIGFQSIIDEQIAETVQQHIRISTVLFVYQQRVFRHFQQLAEDAFQIVLLPKGDQVVFQGLGVDLGCRTDPEQAADNGAQLTVHIGIVPVSDAGQFFIDIIGFLSFEDKIRISFQSRCMKGCSIAGIAPFRERNTGDRIHLAADIIDVVILFEFFFSDGIWRGKSIGKNIFFGKHVAVSQTGSCDVGDSGGSGETGEPDLELAFQVIG